MATIFGVGLRGWGSSLSRTSLDFLPYFSRRFTQSAATQAERKKCIITPEFRRMIIEESQKKPRKEHIIDGINDPGDPCYGIAIESIIETAKKHKLNNPKS